MGQRVRSRDLVPTARPEVKLMCELSNQLLQHERQFGLTPSARASLGIITAQRSQRDGEDDEFFGPK